MHIKSKDLRTRDEVRKVCEERERRKHEEEEESSSWETTRIITCTSLPKAP